MAKVAKNKLYIVLLVVIIAVGAGLFVYNKNSDNSKDFNISDQTDSTNKKSIVDSISDTFNLAPTANEAFEATFSGINEEGEFKMVMRQDKEGNAQYEFLSGEEDGSSMYILKDETIHCADGQCMSIPNTTSNLGDNPGSLIELGDDDIDDYKEKARFIGEETCGNVKCGKWEVTTEDDFNGFIYIDSAGRMVKMTGTDIDGSTIEVAIEYKNVTINRPDNVVATPEY